MPNHTSTVTLTDDIFESEVLRSTDIVLVDFWAPWCGPCRVLGPIVEGLAADFAGQAKIGKLNIDDYTHTASQYGISAVPTLLFFKEGQIVDRVVGVASKKVLADKLNALLQQHSLASEQAA